MRRKTVNPDAARDRPIVTDAEHLDNLAFEGMKVEVDADAVIPDDGWDNEVA